MDVTAGQCNEAHSSNGNSSSHVIPVTVKLAKKKLTSTGHFSENAKYQLFKYFKIPLLLTKKYKTKPVLPLHLLIQGMKKEYLKNHVAE